MIDTTISFTKPEAQAIARALFGESGNAVQDILNRKFINTQGFSVDPYYHAFLAGQRSVALALCAAAQVVGTDYPEE